MTSSSPTASSPFCDAAASEGGSTPARLETLEKAREIAAEEEGVSTPDATPPARLCDRSSEDPSDGLSQEEPSCSLTSSPEVSTPPLGAGLGSQQQATPILCSLAAAETPGQHAATPALSPGAEGLREHITPAPESLSQPPSQQATPAPGSVGARSLASDGGVPVPSSNGSLSGAAASDGSASASHAPEPSDGGTSPAASCVSGGGEALFLSPGSEERKGAALSAAATPAADGGTAPTTPVTERTGAVPRASSAFQTPEAASAAPPASLADALEDRQAPATTGDTATTPAATASPAPGVGARASEGAPPVSARGSPFKSFTGGLGTGAGAPSVGARRRVSADHSSPSAPVSAVSAPGWETPATPPRVLALLGSPGKPPHPSQDSFEALGRGGSSGAAPQASRKDPPGSAAKAAAASAAAAGYNGSPDTPHFDVEAMVNVLRAVSGERAPCADIGNTVQQGCVQTPPPVRRSPSRSTLLMISAKAVVAESPRRGASLMMMVAAAEQEGNGCQQMPLAGGGSPQVVGKKLDLQAVE